MVKRAKLTLEHPEVKEHVKMPKEAEIPELVETEQAVASNRQGKLGKFLIMTGLTIASLIIFKQKII